MTSTKQNTLVFLILLISLLIIYSPALVTEYLYHDDVNFFLQTPTQKFPKSYHFSLSIGRFIGAPIYAGYSWIVTHMSDLYRIRLISIFQFSLIAFLLHSLLSRVTKNRAVSVGTALAITCLPSFQVLATQAGYAFQTTGVLLSVLSAWFVAKTAEEKSWRKKLFSLQSLSAYVLFILAIATHPSTAMFYWVGAAIIVLSQHRQKLKSILHQVILVGGIGCVSMGSYAIILKLIKPLQRAGNYGIYNPYSVSTDVTAKIKWFFTEPMINALNLFNIFPVKSITWITISLLITISILICIHGLTKQQPDLRRKQLLKIIAIGISLVGFILLSFSTNLLAVGDAAFYRCTIALSGLVLLYLSLGLSKSLELFIDNQRHRAITLNILFTATVTLVGLQTHNNIKQYRIKPSEIEINHLINSIRQVDLSQYGRIHLIHPNRKLLKNRYDEFGGPTSSFRGDTVGFISAGIIEALKDKYDIYHIHFDFKSRVASYVFTDSSDEKKAFRVQITSDAKDVAIYGSIPTLIIDMTEIYRQSAELSYLRRDS